MKIFPPQVSFWQSQMLDGEFRMKASVVGHKIRKEPNVFLVGVTHHIGRWYVSPLRNSLGIYLGLVVMKLPASWITV